MKWFYHFSRLALLLILSTGSLVSHAQGDTLEVYELEYFFDVDPGVNAATKIAVGPDTILNMVPTLPTSGLSTGFHMLGIRARNLTSRPSFEVDDTLNVYVKPSNWINPTLLLNGDWGLTETRLVFVDQSDGGAIINVDQIEYFLDVDPGVGSASPAAASFSPSNIVSIIETINSDTLSTGFHILGMRARAEGGAWGVTETRLIFVDPSQGTNSVDQIEYFFDTDPGVGSASQVAASFSPNNIVSIIETINSDTLSTGFHILGMRARAEGGAWGVTETRLIFVDPSQGTINVDQIEYFFDTDPGLGSAIQVTNVTPTNSVSIVETLNTSGLSLGFHILGMRARSEGGEWGTTESRLIVVDQAGAITNVTEFEYFIGNDPGVGNATSIPVATPGPQVNESVVLNTDTVSIGNYQIHFRARNAAGDWGLTESRPFQVVNMEAPIITSSESSPSNTTPLNMMVSFGEAVNGFDESDIMVSSGGSVQGGSFNTVNDSSFTFLLDLTTEGLITVDLADSVATALDDGTPSPTSETFKVVYDITAPVVTVDTLFTVDNSPALSGTVDTDSVSIQITVDGSTYPASSISGGIWTLAAGTITALGNGIYDVIVQATDSANNVGTDATTNELIIDILEVTVDTVSTSDFSPELTGTVTDTAATVDITVDGSTYAAVVKSDNTWTLAAGTITPPLAEGTYDVDASADRGVEGVVNDLTTNELTIFSISVFTSIDQLSTNSRSPALTGTISNATATVDVTVDGSTYAATNNGDSTWMLASGTIAPDLQDGIYDVAVLADVGGTQGADSTVNELRVDGTAPIVTIDFLATSISSPQLSGTIDDPDATIDISVGGSNYSAANNGDNTWTLAASIISPGLTDNTYSIVATATDSLGNQGADTTEDELIITSTLLAVPAADITSTSFTARWSQGEDVLNYELDVSTTSDFSTLITNFDALETTATSLLVGGLDFGTNYYYRVRLVNTASEVSANSNAVTVKTTVDPETIADSTALVQIYNALDGPVWTSPVNWETARLRTWDGVILDATKTRVEQVDISSQGALGNMPNPFTGTAVGGLTALSSMNLSDNQIAGLIDFDSTNVTSLDVSNNALDFGDLESVSMIAALTYSPQANLNFQEAMNTPIESPHLSNPLLTASAGGDASVYSFSRNGEIINNGSEFAIADSVLTIQSIDFDNMGEFAGNVTNSLLPELTIQITPQTMLAVADLSMTIVDGSGSLLVSTISGYLLETVRRQQGFDTLERADNVNSSFVFENVVLGNYLCGIDPSNKELFIPTYFGNEFEWSLADTVFFREAASVEVQITEVPIESTPGPGTLDILVEEDFPEEGSRIDARRRAAKRKCGLRRKRSGGRTGQDDDEFELVAYGETDENGEFRFGFLPQGIYRFFVEYPGIPLDESSEVEFEVGEAGISDTDFKLEAFVNEDGIEVTIERILGNILTYFKNLEVYPNPTSDFIKIKYRHLKSADVNAQLVDISGTIFWTSKIENGYDGYKEVDVSEFSEGIYLLHVFDSTNREENVVTYRIIVKE